MWKVAVLLAAVVTPQTAVACQGTVGNYDWLGRELATQEVTYFIGRLTHYQKPETTDALWRVTIENLRSYDNRVPLQAEYQLEPQGCAGVSVFDGMIAAFATYEQNGIRYLAGWPGNF